LVGETDPSTKWPRCGWYHSLVGVEVGLATHSVDSEARGSLEEAVIFLPTTTLVTFMVTLLLPTDSGARIGRPREKGS